MIISPIGEFKNNRKTLPHNEMVLVDAIVYDMLNIGYKVKELQITLNNHFIQFTLNSGMVLQFIVDKDDCKLLVMLYQSV